MPPTAAERFVVHCLTGQSRSPGIALGLCELHGWDTGDLDSATRYGTRG